MKSAYRASTFVFSKYQVREPSAVFKLRQPCVNCPWRTDRTPYLEPGRVAEFVQAPAFHCHKTVDPLDDDSAPGDKPRQCAGLMLMLHRSGHPNQIMQVGERLGAFDPHRLDAASPVYDNLWQALAAHGGNRETMLPRWMQPLDRERMMLDERAIERARRLATDLHEGQFDKAGKAYIMHPARVASILLRRWPDATTAEIEAAWLHDVLEDTSVTEVSLRDAGISIEAIEIVKLLTRPPGSTYEAWIKSLAECGHKGAIRVKLADNADNSDPERVAAFPEAADMVRERYAPAKTVLEAGLANLLPGRESADDGRQAV